MINCAICDDDLIFTEKVHKLLTASFIENSCFGNINIYNDSCMFISDIIENKPFDLAIIDIEMPHYNGKEIAVELKKRFPECCIIFLTDHIRYAVESYELQIFRYTPKEEIETKLPRYLNDAFKMLSLQNRDTYTINKSTHMENLPYSQILYLRKDGKYAIIRCIHGIARKTAMIPATLSAHSMMNCPLFWVLLEVYSFWV